MYIYEIVHHHVRALEEYLDNTYLNTEVHRYVVLKPNHLPGCHLIPFYPSKIRSIWAVFRLKYGSNTKEKQSSLTLEIKGLVCQQQTWGCCVITLGTDFLPVPIPSISFSPTHSKICKSHRKGDLMLTDWCAGVTHTGHHQESLQFSAGIQLLL